MTDRQLPEPNTNGNEELLSELAWTIEMSEGEFTLLLARCNYSHLRERLVKQLREQYQLKFREIRLEPSVITLYTTIQEALGAEKPTAVMVLGLESVEEIEQVLTSSNQVREEFRKNFPFPLVLWINDELLSLLIRLVPDFRSWGTSFNFTLAADELIDFLQQKVEKVFVAVEAVDELVRADAIFSPVERGEISSALDQLQNQEVELDPELEANLEFCLGQDDYASEQIDSALNHYQQSLDFWQQEERKIEEATDEDEPRKKHSLERQGIILFHIGKCYCHQAQQNQAENQDYWQKAEDTLRESREKFEQAERQDLLAKFIGQLGEVLRQQEAWTELEKLAKKSLQLHKEHDSPNRLAQDYSFLAEIALHREQWDDARQWAEKATFLTTEPQHPQRGLYCLLLAQALRQLRSTQEAIDCLEKATKETKPASNPKVYLRVLSELHSLYYEQKKYLAAFEVKQKQREIELEFRLRAFIGAGQLHALEKELASVFAASGREQDVNYLVNERIALPHYKLTVLYGPSGVGKSSLVNGGLMPVLQGKAIRDRNILPVTLRVYSDWMKDLGKKLAEVPQRRKDVENLPNLPKKGSITIDSLEGIKAQLRANADNHWLTVLIFDQFEEFFFVCTKLEERREFYGFLLECLKGIEIQFVKVILSLREDYLHNLLEFEQFAAAQEFDSDLLRKDQRYYLGNFSPAAAEKLIRELTQRAQLGLESDLIDAVVQDLTTELKQVLPIELQVVGAQLQTEKISTLKDYQEKGPKEKLVERYLEDVIRDCGGENQRAASSVLYLLTDENNTRPLKTKTELGKELAAEADKLDLVLEILVKSGLVFRLSALPEDNYQLVHDYLVKFIRQQQGSEILAELQEEKEQRILIQKKHNRFLKRTAIGSGVAVLVLAVVTTLALVFARNSRRQTQMAIARELAATSERIGSQYPDLYETSALLAAESMKRLEDIEELSLEVDRALRKSLILLPNYIARIQDVVGSVVFSGDSKYLATRSRDNTAQLHFLDSKELMIDVCRHLKRNLTVDEWRAYIGLYEKTCKGFPIHLSLLEEGKRLVQIDNLKAAIDIFRRAQQLDPEIDLNPDTQETIEKNPKAVAQNLAALAKVKEGERLAKEGKVEEAIALFKQAQQLNPDIDLNPDTEVIDKDPKAVAEKLQP